MTVRPIRIDEAAQRGDVVHERVLGLDKNYVSYLVKGFGGGDSSIPAADDYDCCHSSQLLSSWHVR